MVIPKIPINNNSNVAGAQAGVAGMQQKNNNINHNSMGAGSNFRQ